MALGAARPWYGARRKSLVRALVHQTQHHSPRTHVGKATPPGGRRRASRRLYSVRTPRGWLGPARGEFLAPNSSLGPPPVLPADFWATGRARNPLDFVRWVVPISKRVVVIHCARPYTSQKVSGGCVTAISGSASKFAEDTCYEVRGSRARKEVGTQGRRAV
jgi:hypothetical protein